MKIVTAEQMRRIDEVAIRERGIAGSVLMERAGKAVAREAMERFEPHSVAVVAGKGNNGGDGFVAARELHLRGVRTVVYPLFDPAEARGDALEALRRLPPDVPVQPPPSPAQLREELVRYDLVIDAILGTGLKGPVEGPLAEAIEAINACQTNVLAVDVPSGLLAGERQSGGPHVRAQVTVTMGLPKLGLIVEPGRSAAGIVSVADIGFPTDLIENPSMDLNLLTPEELRRWLPPRPPAGHKGTFGRVLILAGSEGMTGAAVLTARAAVRSGAGLVYVAYPRPLGPILETQLIEPVKRPLAGRLRWFTEAQAAAALKEADGVQAVALGPGLGRRPTTRGFVLKVLARLKIPVLVDADAVCLMAGRLEAVARRPGPTVLTPHPGELATLLDRSTSDILAERLTVGRDLATRHGFVVVLKGAQTVVAAPDGQRYINPSGNTGLAKGGSGDVLTGLLTGLLGQGVGPLQAAALAVFLHGVAADKAAQRIGVRAMNPSDVIDHLGEAFVYLERGSASRRAGVELPPA